MRISRTSWPTTRRRVDAARFISAGATGALVVTVRVSDGEPESEPCALLVTALPDEEPPVLSLIGGALIEITVGEIFTDPGAAATDNLDGDDDLTEFEVVDASQVDTRVAGRYEVFYDVEDAAGNAAETAVRVVIVENPPTPPAPPTHSSGGGSMTMTFLLLLLCLKMIRIVRASLREAGTCDSI